MGLWQKRATEKKKKDWRRNSSWLWSLCSWIVIYQKNRRGCRCRQVLDDLEDISGKMNTCGAQTLSRIKHIQYNPSSCQFTRDYSATSQNSAKAREIALKYTSSCWSFVLDLPVGLWCAGIETKSTRLSAQMEPAAKHKGPREESECRLSLQTSEPSVLGAT